MRPLALAALLFALLAPAAAAQEVESVTETFRVPTVDGAKVWVEVTRPKNVERAPVILTYTPYGVLGYSSQDDLWERYGPKGYARAIADVLGTRNSGGCWDYGGPREQQSGVDLVNFLAGQPWSNGKVAMIGGSYDGTTANMVAAAGEKAFGLAAIVPEVAISRWYGYAYSHGVRYSGNSQEPTDEGADTPAAFDFGLTRVPPSDPMAIDVVADRIRPCDADSHTAHGYDTSPDYDEFWMQRDYLKDAHRFRVPTLVVHGWQDYNVKQEEGHRLYAALDRVPWKGFYFWQAPHASPDHEEYTTLLDAFFDRFLLGLPNSGLERLPSVYTQGRDHEEAGPLEGLPSWPPPRTGEVELALGRSDDGGTLGNPGGEPASYRDAPASSEEAAAENFAAEGSWLAYQSAPLPGDLRIAGEPVLDATITVDRDAGHLVPTLFDVDAGGSAVPISRGFLNLRYKDGLHKETPAPVGTPTRAVVTFKPQDWTVRAGHRIALVVQSSNPAWAVPAPPGLGVTVTHGGASRLLLPVAGAAPPGASRPLVPGGRPNARPIPARASLSVRARASKRRLRISGRTAPGVDVKLTVRRGKRATRRRIVTSRSSGAFRVVVRVRRAGRYRITAAVRTRDGVVRKRTRPIRVR